MGKAHRINRFAHKKDFLIRFAGTFLATLGLPSALLTILGKHFSVSVTIELIAFASILSCVVNWRTLKYSHLPVSDIIAGSLEAPENTHLHCPCNSSLAEEAKLLARECYATDKNSLTPEQFEYLRVKNPLILACLTSERGEFLGYFDMIPLERSFAQLLLKGIVTENQITHEHVFSTNEMRSCEFLFISGLAVWDADTYTGRRNASMLVWGMLKYLDHYYSKAKPVVFAIASTDSGDELMRRFRLPLGCEPAGRIDKYPVYAIRLSREEIVKRLACLPDWAPLCTLQWQSNDSATKKPPQKHRRPSPPRAKAYSLPATAAPRVAT